MEWLYRVNLRKKEEVMIDCFDKSIFYLVTPNILLSSMNCSSSNVLLYLKCKGLTHTPMVEVLDGPRIPDSEKWTGSWLLVEDLKLKTLF